MFKKPLQERFPPPFGKCPQCGKGTRNVTRYGVTDSAEKYIYKCPSCGRVFAESVIRHTKP